MRVFQIQKRSGGMRTIYMPSHKERARLRGLLGVLHAVAESRCPPGVVHGFYRGRSPVSNAAQHTGYKISLCFDLADFFDTVTAEHFKGVKFLMGGTDLTEQILESCLVDGAARQGLPTSPVMANIAAAPLDWELLCLRRQTGWFAYTRYADDLTFSFNDESCVEILSREVPRLVEQHGFKINSRKTELMRAAQGRRHITGVAVDDDVRPTRAAKRRLRAAQHQQRKSSAEGLAEWCLCKLPSKYVHVRTYAENDFDSQSDKLMENFKE